jgi:glycosyltransferase involved in cell wall biosynthesis
LKKLLFLIRSLNVGGAERQLLTLVDSLDRQKYDPFVVTFYSEGNLLPEFAKKGIRIISAQKSGRWDVFGFLKRLLAIIRTENPDILIAYLVAANILCILLKPFLDHTKIIISIRHSFIRKEDYDRMSNLMYWFEDRIARFSDAIIINSFVGASQARARGIPVEKIVVIPNGIDTSVFIPDNTLRTKKRSELGYGAKETVIGMVGRLDPVKDHGTLIKAAAMLVPTNENVRFLIVGDGPRDYTEKIRQEISGLKLEDVFLIIPAETNPVQIYNALDICVSASIGEGFSNVIAEAMSCEVPCVVTDVGDSGMIVGKTGLVVPPGDAFKLADAISELLSKPSTERETLGREARERIVSEFSVVKMVAASALEFDRLG